MQGSKGFLPTPPSRPELPLIVLWMLSIPRIITAWQWLMSLTCMPCIPMQTELKKSPLRKRLKALSSETLSTFPPQADHILVDLFSSVVVGRALWDGAPAHLVFIFILLINCSCAPRDHLCSIRGQLPFLLTVQGPVQPHSTPAWHWGFVSCCCDPMAVAPESCRFPALFIEPSCAKIPAEFHWKCQTVHGLCILACYQTGLILNVAWLSFPCLLLSIWAIACRGPEAPATVSGEEHSNSHIWLSEHQLPPAILWVGYASSTKNAFLVLVCQYPVYMSFLTLFLVSQMWFLLQRIMYIPLSRVCAYLGQVFYTLN